MQAVIFDMNGVIIDDEHIHEHAFAQVLKAHGIELTHQAYLDSCAGRTDKAGFEQVSEHYAISFDIDRALQAKAVAYLTLFPKHKRAYPGVIELINVLHNHYVLALTTSSSKTEADLVLAAFNMKDAFGVVVTADDVSKGKPDPQPYVLTASRLGIDPRDCMVIEDSTSGVRSAKAAGMHCIAITTTHAASDLLQADAVVHSFDAINKHLAG
jgi:HAD superfamily hydrolase (TIGR01509 family)